MIKRVKHIACMMVLFLGFQVQAQNDSLRVHFNLTFNRVPLKSEHWYFSAQQDSIQMQTLKFYVSDLEIEFTDNSKLKALKTHHLVDWSAAESLQLTIGKANLKKIKQITFNVGVDSLSSVSGALGGDLDPTRGMYWAWQSGYINFKIEGKCPKLTSRKKQFQYHIGGYAAPYNALRKIVYQPSEQNPTHINVDIAAFFNQLKLTDFSSVMMPGKRAMKLADDAVLMFSP